MAALGEFEYDYLVRCIMVGDSGVGKSAILRRFSHGEFVESQIPTIGVDFAVQGVRLADKVCKLQVWDTAGQDRFRSITKSFYRGADFVLVVFDVTKRETFDHVRSWLEDVATYGKDTVEIVLVGNKVDDVVNRTVSFETAASFAKDYGIVYMECSAKSGDGIQQAFVSATTLWVKSAAERERAAPLRAREAVPLRPVERTNECCAFM
jgi:Ras-related protein Rab-1A